MGTPIGVILGERVRTPTFWSGRTDPPLYTKSEILLGPHHFQTKVAPHPLNTSLAKYIGRRLFTSTLIVWTHAQTYRDRLLYLDH